MDRGLKAVFDIACLALFALAWWKWGLGAGVCVLAACAIGASEGYIMGRRAS